MRAKPAEDNMRLGGDDFQDGFSIGSPSAKWSYFSIGPYTANDGLVITSENGLRVVASGVNRHTGEPALGGTRCKTLQRQAAHQSATRCESPLTCCSAAPLAFGFALSRSRCGRLASHRLRSLCSDAAAAGFSYAYVI
jgi:hypothetical protein